MHHLGNAWGVSCGSGSASFQGVNQRGLAYVGETNNSDNDLLLGLASRTLNSRVVFENIEEVF